MKLRSITITGVDDQVDPRDLIAISREYPFVEWGLLRSAKRQGEPRYPSEEWMCRWIQLVADEPSVKFAVHLCGFLARRALGGRLIEDWGAPRVQLNGFSDWEHALLPCNVDSQWILQCNSEEAIQRARKLRERHDVAVLWDQSGGQGKPGRRWPDPLPHLPRGYAGGITPGHVPGVVEVLSAKSDFIIGPLGYWIDMESGVFTDGKFDLDKAREAARNAAPWIGREP